MTRVRVINPKDELFEMEGEIDWIGSGGYVMVLFNDGLPVRFQYHESELEVIEDE